MRRLSVVSQVFVLLSTGLVVDAWALEDPTRPVRADVWVGQRSSFDVNRIRLQAIFERATAKQALIDDVMLGEGDATQAYTLLEIKSDRVVIQRLDGTRRELLLTADIKELQ